MVLTKEQRIEYLKKAREAKALRRKNDLSQLKIDEAKQSKESEPIIEPIKVIEKPKLKKVNKSLDLTTIKDPPSLTPKIEVVDDEVVEIHEEIVKVKKPKRIIRKIIKQEYESETDEEIIEEIIPPKYKEPKIKKELKPKKVKDDVISSLFNY